MPHEIGCSSGIGQRCTCDVIRAEQQHAAVHARGEHCDLCERYAALTKALGETE